jgi:uncharacterized protein YggU (UPF0235/DUF167 family)
MNMKVWVKVKTKAKENKVTPPEQTLWEDSGKEKVFSVSVKEAPINGEANRAIKKLLAQYFCVAQSCVVLKKGEISKTKMFEVIV